MQNRNSQAANPAEILAEHGSAVVSSAMSQYPTGLHDQHVFDFLRLRESVRARRTIESEKRQDSQRAIEGLLQRSGIPKRFLSKDFSSYVSDGVQQRRARNLCERYAQNFSTVLEKGICLVLTGRPGTGKTHLSAAILLAVMQTGRSGLFVTVSEMLRSIRETYSPRAKHTEEEVFNHYIGVDLLVLDEVGVSIGDDDKRKAMIFDVINGRYAEMRPTVIIGNLNEQSMQDYLGERVWDRLMESEAPLIVFDWDSHRQGRAGAV